MDDGSDSGGEELHASQRMQRMRVQVAAAKSMCGAMEGAASWSLCSDNDDSSDEEEPGPGRGAPGRPRGVADIYGDPDDSLVARDIMSLRANPDDELLLKKFRRSYRVPWLVFEELVKIAWNMPFQKNKDPNRRQGRKMIPVEILVGASMRHLGKGHDFEDTLYRETFVSGSFLLKFHHAFMDWLGGPNSNFFKQYVYWPEEGSEEMRDGLAVYAALGMPGCVASVDGTHIPYQNARNEVVSWFVPSLYHPGPRAVLVLSLCCPCLCTVAVPSLYRRCTVPVPCVDPSAPVVLHRRCTVAVPSLYRCCTVAVPLLYRSCSDPVPYCPCSTAQLAAVLYRSCTVPVPFLCRSCPEPPQ